LHSLLAQLFGRVSIFLNMFPVPGFLLGLELQKVRVGGIVIGIVVVGVMLVVMVQPPTRRTPTIFSLSIWLSLGATMSRTLKLVFPGINIFNG
jgi:hypothetical protein